MKLWAPRVCFFLRAYTCDCDRQSLDALVRGKELELEQAAEAYRNLQWLKQQSEEKERNTLREKDTIIGQLQAALQTHSQETQVTDTQTYTSFMPLLSWLLIVCCVIFNALLKPIHTDKPVLLVFTNTTGVLTQPFPVGVCFCFFVCV